MGGGVVIASALAAGLVDEYRLFVYPAVQGRGRRLVPDGVEIPKLSLVQAKSFSNGVALLIYTPTEDARILSVAVMRDGWPPQRAVAGYDLAPTTPIPNLWNVGDGVKEYANGGTTACAETAQIVAGQVTAHLSAAGTPAA